MITRNYIKAVLRGVGQVMLQNNALSGLLFLVGIFYNSWLMGLGAIIGTITSTLVAGFLRYSEDDIQNGLYGFNGALVGIAVWFFFECNFFTIITIISSAILSSIIMHEVKKRIPAFSVPFVLSTWIIIAGVQYFNFLSFKNYPVVPTSFFNLASASINSIGQVMFQENTVTGLLFLFGILINSPVAAVYALYGAILSSILAILFSFPLTMINQGLFGYNAVLCAIALEDKKWGLFSLASFSITVSVLLNFALDKAGLITLTVPFVFATWMALLIKKHKNLN